MIKSLILSKEEDLKAYRYYIALAKEVASHYDGDAKPALLGLVRAIYHFDPEKGHKFSTYATWWMKEEYEKPNLPVGRQGCVKLF